MGFERQFAFEPMGREGHSFALAAGLNVDVNAAEMIEPRRLIWTRELDATHSIQSIGVFLTCPYPPPFLA
jgi:hypothetical protein